MPANPKAKYVITADDQTAAAWASALKSADSAGRKISGIMKTAFAGVGLAAITGQIKAAINFGDEIGKAAVKAGVGAREMSELAYAAKMSDIEIGALSTGLRKMQVSIAEASRGNKELQGTFRGIGVDLQSFRQLKPDQQFEALADAIHGIRDPAERARVVTQLFGKAGADLLPAFQDGARGIREAREEAERLGISMSEETVKALQAGDDAMKKLAATWDGFMAKVAVGAVKIAEAIDLIPKDQLGELKDDLRDVQKIIANMRDDGAPLTVLDPFVAQAEALHRQIAALEDRYTRGGGSRRGGASDGPPERKASYDELIHEVGITDAPRFEAFQYLRQQEQDTEKYKEALVEAYEYSQFVGEQTSDGIARAFEENEAALEQTMEGIQYLYEETTKKSDEMSVYAEEAARNMQSHFADFLFDPFENGLDGMAKGFIDVIRRMLAEAAAAKVFEKLFGKSGSGGSGAGNWLGTLFSSFFGGFKAEGGPLQQNKWYVAGEKGPEPIWGGGAGAFAAGYGGGMGGSTSIDARLSIDARGATQDAVKELVRSMPEMQRRWSDQVESKIITGIKRRQYNLG
jgi:hypothetical protein